MGLDSAVERACTYRANLSLSYIAALLRFWEGLKDFHPNWMVNYQTSLPAQQQHRELVHLQFMDWLWLTDWGYFFYPLLILVDALEYVMMMMEVL